MIARAIQRNVNVSARKANLCCRLIRNRPFVQALRILDNQPNKSAKFLRKLLLSAASNAVNNHAMSGSKLYVFSSVANQGVTLKRTLTRAKGRADLLRKRFSHLEVCLSDDLQERQKLNKILLKPRAHRQKKSEISKEDREIKPKIISKKQKEMEKV